VKGVMIARTAMATDEEIAGKEMTDDAGQEAKIAIIVGIVHALVIVIMIEEEAIDHAVTARTGETGIVPVQAVPHTENSARLRYGSRLK
jgi:hypothetical protein